MEKLVTMDWSSARHALKNIWLGPVQFKLNDSMSITYEEGLLKKRDTMGLAEHAALPVKSSYN